MTCGSVYQGRANGGCSRDWGSRVEEIEDPGKPIR
jgi:hypothetical protein